MLFDNWSVKVQGSEKGVKVLCHARFLFKNNICSTTFGLRRFLFFKTISPAFENTRSQGTDDAGVHKNVCAST